MICLNDEVRVKSSSVYTHPWNLFVGNWRTLPCTSEIPPWASWRPLEVWKQEMCTTWRKEEETSKAYVGKAWERAAEKERDLLSLPPKISVERAVQQLVWNLRFIRRQVNVKQSTAKVQFLCWKAVWNVEDSKIKKSRFRKFLCGERRSFDNC